MFDDWIFKLVPKHENKRAIHSVRKGENDYLSSKCNKFDVLERGRIKAKYIISCARTAALDSLTDK